MSNPIQKLLAAAYDSFRNDPDHSKRYKLVDHMLKILVKRMNRFTEFIAAASGGPALPRVKDRRLEILQKIKDLSKETPDNALDGWPPPARSEKEKADIMAGSYNAMGSFVSCTSTGLQISRSRRGPRLPRFPLPGAEDDDKIIGPDRMEQPSPAFVLGPGDGVTGGNLEPPEGVGTGHPRELSSDLQPEGFSPGFAEVLSPLFFMNSTIED